MMQAKDINVMQLEAVATALGPLLPDVVFVGGSTTALLVDEAAHFGVRRTDDVDVIIDVATLADYHGISARLRELGFWEDTEGPICRWLVDSEVGTVKLDIMPTDEEILGFSNRWYRDAIEQSMDVSLPSGITIKIVGPAYFLATKFEAFIGRGKGDYFSHDLEDIIFVLENRARLIMELMDSPDELKHYLSQQATLLLNDDFLNVLPGLLNDPNSARAVVNGLNIMKSWS